MLLIPTAGEGDEASLCLLHTRPSDLHDHEPGGLGKG